jgi:hypothetical protein
MTSHPLVQSITALALSWVSVLVWFVSNPGIDYLELLIALAGTIVVLAAVLVSGVKGLIGRRANFLFASVLLVLLAAAVTIFVRAQSPSNPLFRIRFALSQSAFANRAAMQAGPETMQGSQWVGLFRVARIERLDNEVRFITGMCGVVDQCGLVFRPGPPTQVHSKERLRRLSGSWYHLYDVF